MSSLDQFGAKTWPSLREIVRDDHGEVVCPVSGQVAEYTRGEQAIPVVHVLDDHLRTALEAAGIETLRGRGYESPDHEVIMPETCSGPDAHGYSHKFVGVPVAFSGGRQFVPVLRDELLDAGALEQEAAPERPAAPNGEAVSDEPEPEHESESEHERTRVGHWNADRDECTVYAGRAGENGEKNLLTAEIGEDGWLGNPYSADEYGREEAVAMFMHAFFRELEVRPALRKAVYELRGETLGCWCQQLDEDAPLCHAQVIADVADRAIVRRSGGESRD